MWGAPFQVIDEVTLSGRADSEWLNARVGELSQKAMCVYAHLGLESADAIAREVLDGPLKFGTDVPDIREPDIHSPITSYCLSP